LGIQGAAGELITRYPFAYPAKDLIELGRKERSQTGAEGVVDPRPCPLRREVGPARGFVRLNEILEEAARREQLYTFSSVDHDPASALSPLQAGFNFEL
jgi:hypothetical protein